MRSRGPVAGRTARVAVLAAGVASACRSGPSLPGELTFEGARLEKATTWSRGGISGVVFVPPGEKMPSASLQVGVLLSEEHASGAELNRWIMDQYRTSPTAQVHESVTEDEACKIGIAGGARPRVFVALHVCRSAGGVAACAEADRQLADADVSRCAAGPAGSCQEICTLRWLPTRASLEPILDGVLKKR
jgi:hypothetical protein